MNFLNPIQDGHFQGCSQVGREGQKDPPLHKICHIYPTTMKLGTVIPYLKEIKKTMNQVIHPLTYAAFFHGKSSNFVISRNTDIDCILVHNL